MGTGKAEGGAGSPERYIGQDTRQEVANTYQPPYSAICALDIMWPNGKYSVGTGYIFGERTLFTVGHNLFDPTRGGLATRVGILPGATCGTAPFGYLVVDSGALRIFPGWQERGNITDDFGAIILPQPLGRRTGWSDLAPFPDIRRGDGIVVSGFPSEGVHNWHELRMMRATGSILEHFSDFAYHDADATGGQSGSPVWRISDQAPSVLVFGFHKGELIDQPANVLMLLNDQHFDWIHRCMAFAEGPRYGRSEADAGEVEPRRHSASPHAGLGPLPDSSPPPEFQGRPVPVDLKSDEKPAPAALSRAAPDDGERSEEFRVPAKGHWAMDLDLRAGDIVKGRIKVALPSGTFTDCDLVFANDDDPAIDHLPMFVSSSGAKDFHSDRFTFAALTDGRHRLVFRELNGVSAAIVQMKFRVV
jgi:V8-like Glu-specific endopeptidase